MSNRLDNTNTLTMSVLNSSSPLFNIPLEIVITDQIGTNGKQKIEGLWRDIRDNAAISPVIVSMIDTLINNGEDLYLFVDMVLGGEHVYISQIV